MKQKLYFLLLMFSSFPLVSKGQITLTQSTSNTIVAGTASCNTGSPDFITRENIHYRAFDLDALGYPSGFHVTEVSFGIESVINESPGFSVDVVIYETDDFPGGTLNLVSSVTVPLVSSDSGTIKTVPISARVCSKFLVYAISVPNENAAGNSTYFFIGSNDLGETSPSYVSSNDCGITTPTPVSTLGFNNHYVMFLEGFPMATHLNFDGANDNVVIPDSPSLDFTTAYTVEAMVKLDRTIGYHQTLVSKYDDDGNNRSWMINFGEHGGGALAVVMTSVGTWTNPLSWNTGFIPTIGSWYHVAVVFDSSLPSNQVKLYVDGVLYTQTTWNYTLTPTNANVYIGGYDGFNNGFNAGANSRFLDGSIDEVRMWNVARTAEQIAGSRNCELQGNETGLVTYYKFNQGDNAVDNTTEITLSNAVSSAANGTLTNFTLNGSTSNWLNGSPVESCSMMPSIPSVTTPIAYNQGATATALTATTGTNGTGLLWYTTATGGTGSTTAPTPSTATAGSTSYWVVSTNANGCESERVEIVVNVNAAATHLNFDGVNDYVSVGNIIPNASSYTKEAWVYMTSNTLGRNIFSSQNNPFWISNGILSAGNNGNYAVVQDPTAIPINTWIHVAVTYDAATTTMKLYKNGILVATNTTAPAFVAETNFIGSHNGTTSFFQGNLDEVRIWNYALNQADIQNTMNCEAQTQPELVAYYKFNQGFNNTNNTAITTLIDETGAYNGTLTNFALTGATSNWQSGSTITIGNTCATLSTSGFEAISSLKVYPNPSTGIFTIATQENVTVEVYDLVGKAIVKQTMTVGSNSIDISNYASGIYLLKATNASGKTNTYKIVKQ